MLFTLLIFPTTPFWFLPSWLISSLNCPRLNIMHQPWPHQWQVEKKGDFICLASCIPLTRTQYNVCLFCNPMTQLIHVQHVIYYKPRVFSKENCWLNNCSLSQICLVTLFLHTCSILHLHHCTLPFSAHFCNSQTFWILTMTNSICAALSLPKSL